MTGHYELDALDMYTAFGFVPDRNCGNALLTPPKAKEPVYVNDWAEEDNLEIDEDEAIEYEARQIVLSGHVVANSERLFWEKYTALNQKLSENGTMVLESLKMGVSATVFYISSPNPIKLTKFKGSLKIACRVELIFQEVLPE